MPPGRDESRPYDRFHVYKKGMCIMRILIIGGTRFMGPLVVRMLHEEGHELTVFHRGQSQIELPEGVREISGDRRPLSAVAERLQQVEPEVVLDMIPAIEQDAIEVMHVFKGAA